jgi:basic amino acid/polyamine antiporter, APA family
MRTTNVSVTPDDAVVRPQLKRDMGPWMATALVVGNMVGSGVFLLPAALAAVMVASGSSALLAWAFTGIGAMLLALVFATLGRAYPRTGGPYVFAHRAFGDFAGFWTAWGYWIAAWVGNAAITVAFVGYLGVFWPELTSNHLLAALVGIAAIWVLTAVNVAGVRESGVVQVVSTVLKFVPLVLIAVVGLFALNADNFGPFRLGGWGLGETGVFGGITLAATLTLWAFIGLESATIPAEEVRNPEKTIPRSTIWGTLATTLVYALATIAVVGVIPPATLAGSSSPFADAAVKIFGASSFLGMTWDKWVALVAVIATFGALNGWILIQGRVPMAAAQDGLFPRPFAWVSGKRRTPWFGLVVSSVLVSLVMLMNYAKSLTDQFVFIILLATLTTLVPYAFAAAAQAILMLVDRSRFVGRRLAVDLVVATLGFGYALWAIVGAGYEVIAKGFVLLMVGVPVYVLMKWWQVRSRPAAPQERLTVSVDVDGERLAPLGVSREPMPTARSS